MNMVEFLIFLVSVLFMEHKLGIRHFTIFRLMVNMLKP